MDPNYALAWAGLADANTALGYYGFAAPGEFAAEARRAAARALELGPDLAEAHNSRACSALLFDRDWATAEREFVRALELTPGYTQARGWYALFYLQFVAGRIDEGVEEARRALEIDPLSAYAMTVCAFTLGLAESKADAISYARLALERDPESYIAGWVLQLCLLWDSQFAESVAAGETALALSGRHSWALAGLVAAHAEWGKAKEARALYDEFRARAQQQYMSPVIGAWVSASVGEDDESRRLVEQALEDGDPLLHLFPRMPHFRPMLAMPGVRAVLRRLNFPDGWPPAEAD